VIHSGNIITVEPHLLTRPRLGPKTWHRLVAFERLFSIVVVRDPDG